MLIIQRYLFREVMQSFAGVLAVLTLVFVSHRFVRFITEAAAGRLSSDLLFQLLGLKLAANMALLLPLALFMGVLLGLGRLYKDSEVVAMQAGGIGVGMLARYVFGISLAVAALTAVFALVLGPRMTMLEEQVFARARGQAEVTGVVPGRFKPFGEGSQVIYVESLSEDQREMRDVFVQLRRGERLQILVARKAYQAVLGEAGERFVVLEDGHRYEGTPGRSDYVVTRFEKHAVRIDRIGDTEVRNPLEARTTGDLWRGGRANHIAELQWRVSLPISAVLLGTLAVPLSRTSPRQGRYARLFMGVVVYFAYSNSLGIAQKYVQSAAIPAWIGVWPVHAVLALLIAWFLLSPASRRELLAKVSAPRRRGPRGGPHRGPGGGPDGLGAGSTSPAPGPSPPGAAR